MAGQKIVISVDAPTDQQSCVQAFEAAAKTICELANIAPAERPMLLLTAAVHMAMQGASAPINEVIEDMAVRLGEAVITADDLFGLSRNRKDA